MSLPTEHANKNIRSGTEAKEKTFLPFFWGGGGVVLFCFCVV